MKKTIPTAEEDNIEFMSSSSQSTILKHRGIFLLFDEIHSRAAQEVVQWILDANYDDNRQYDNLTLIVNSPGGEIPSAFAIIDAIRGSKIPVHTVGLGIIASCGLMVFIAGHKGHRILTPNTSILSHQFSGGHQGKQHELVAGMKYFEFLKKRVITHYKKCTGLTEAEVESKLLPADDVWLDSKEALKHNICDKVREM